MSGFDLFAQQNRFSDFLHGFLAFAALALEREIGFVFVHGEIALQDSLRAVDEAARFGQLRELRFFGFQERPLNFGTNQETDYGEETDFALAVKVRLAVLQIYDSHQTVAGQHRHGEQRLITILGEIVERLKAGIEPGAVRYSNGLPIFRHPT